MHVCAHECDRLPCRAQDMGLLLSALGMGVAAVKEMDDNALAIFIGTCEKSKHIKAASVAELDRQAVPVPGRVHVQAHTPQVAAAEAQWTLMQLKAYECNGMQKNARGPNAR